MTTKLAAGSPIVDAHHHLWSLAEVPRGWLAPASGGEGMLGDLAPIRRDYDARAYSADVTGVNVVASVHVEAAADDPLAETRWLESQAASSGLPTVLVVACELERPDVRALLEEHLATSSRVRGVRQMLNWHDRPGLRSTSRPDLLADPDWRRGLALLGELGLSFDVQVFPHQLEDVAAVARRYPEVAFVLDHGGLLATGTPAERELRRRGLRRLADVPNVAVKISGFGINNDERSAEALREWFFGLVDVFGAERAMIGSDLPVDKLHGEANPLVALAGLCDELAPAESRAVRLDTACRVYGIESP